MTANQTIYGVPRAVLSDAFDELPDWNTPAATKLRALLDATDAGISASPATRGDPVAYQFQDRDGKWCGFMNERHYQNTIADGTWPIRALYAEQPKGAPACVIAFREGVKEPEILSWNQLPVGEHRLYAEQPAPVAVVLPERLLGDDGVCTESHYASGWNNCLDAVARLNPSL